MTALSTAAGVLLVLVASRDIFDRILHPAGSGHISGAVMRATFAVLRRVSTRRPGAIDVAGPLGILFSIFTWAVMVAVGWALIYLPHIPAGLVRIRTDYLHFAGARFFHMSDPRSSLSTALLKLWRMAAAAEGGEDAKGEAGALLRKAVEELVEVMRRQPEIEAGPDTGPEEVLRRYARVHRREPLDV